MSRRVLMKELEMSGRADLSRHAVRARTRSVAFAMLASLTVLAGCSGDASLAGPTITETTQRKPSDPTTVVPSAPTANPIEGARFWVEPISNASRTAALWRTTRPADAAQMDKIAAQPQVTWYGDWNSTATLAATVDASMSTIIAAGRTPVYVAYNIPQRDCGGYSANGTSVASYRTWISAFAAGLRGRKAVVVLEPDALPDLDCLPAADQAVRLELMRSASATLTAAGALVYLDAGHPGWNSAATMALRLANAGIASAAGFSLNVSNFAATSDNVTYGREISSLVGGKHFLIDTSRNGVGTNGQWCNPAGRALGTRPTSSTGDALVDAFLWIKAPGESDGECNGAATAGVWMPEYALGLAQRASY